MSGLSALLELLNGVFQKLFPDKVSALKSNLQDWYKGAVERAALRKKEEQDGSPKS